MPRILLLCLLGMLLVSQIDAQKSKRKSKFKALLPVFERSKPKPNSIAEKPTKTASASSSSTVEAGGTLNTGKATASQPVSPPKEVILPEPSKPVKQPQDLVIQSPKVKSDRPKATPYSLLLPDKPVKKPAKSRVEQYRPAKPKFPMTKTKPSWSHVPSKPKSKSKNVNFFGMRPKPTTTPKPTTPAPPLPVQQSLFNFFNGQNVPSPAQQAMPFPLPSMPPYPGLPNNNPQLNNVYKMIATWLVSHAMHGGNNVAPTTPRPVPTTPKQTPPPMRFSAKRAKPHHQHQRKNSLSRPQEQARRPNRNRKRTRSQKKANKKNKDSKKQEEALRRMRQKAYEEYMDEVYDIDVPEKPFANGAPPYHQGPPFGFPW